jgi:MFS family permease
VARPLRIGLGAAAGLAALSLLLPYQPLYDPWGWLVWGRELVHLDLATAEGMSWKPLPVLVAAPLTALGDAAPQGWLLAARAGWLAAPLLAGWLAARLAGPEAGRWRLAAATMAAGSVALAADSFTPPARQFAGGLSEPLLVALVLGAVAAAIERRPLAALWLGFAAALLRPECWPFLAVWVVWAARREPRLYPHAALVAILVPLAWFVPDLLGAGDPLAGSRTARGGPIEPLDAFPVLGRALAAPLAGAWIGVALFLALRREGSRDDRAMEVLLAGAAAWVALVAAMAVGGYAGLPRFLAPATAAIGVVGSVGVARAAAAAFARGAARPVLAATVGLALAVAALGFGLRLAAVPDDLRDVDRQSTLVDGMFELAGWVPAERLFSCGDRVRLANLLAPPTALAWKLDRPLASVRAIPHPEYGVALSTRALPGRRIAQIGRWRATDLGC